MTRVAGPDCALLCNLSDMHRCAHTVRRGIKRGQISRDGNGDDGGNGNEDKNRGDNGIH